jgi:hypothetical protein
MRKKRIIAFVVGILVIIIVIVALYVQTSPTTPEQFIPEEIPSDFNPPEELTDVEIPFDTFVVPEVPLGTLGIMLAFFFALVISHMKQKVKLQ